MSTKAESCHFHFETTSKNLIALKRTVESLYKVPKKILADHGASATNKTGSSKLGSRSANDYSFWLFNDVVLDENEVFETRRADRGDLAQ